MAARVSFSARPKILRPSCWSLPRVGELPERTRATEEVAKESGEAGMVFWYKGSRCSR